MPPGPQGGAEAPRWGIAIPQFLAGPALDIATLRTFLTRAEELGFESAWVLDQVVGQAAFLDAIPLLSYAAALTQRLQLGVAVLVVPIRNPVLMAKAIATIDHLSGGRAIVGLGLGARTDIYPAFGIGPERRVARLLEGVEQMLDLWTRDAVTRDGAFWSLREVSVSPKPLQRPHPRLWFGGRAPAALRRAVRLGDGWIGGGTSTTKDFAADVVVVRAALAEAGRDPSTFAVAKRVYLVIDEDADRASARVREWFDRVYGSPDLGERVALFGGLERCIEGVRDVRMAGADLLLLHPIVDELQHLEVLARDVVPAVAGA